MLRGGFALLLLAFATVSAAAQVYVPGPPAGVRAQARGLVPPAVLPPDRAALEQVLTGALEGSGPGQPDVRTLPSTSSLTVVASPSFTRRGGEPCIGCRNPCRNFRYTYVRPDRGSVSVEGTRCRRPNGRWAPLTPDMVVAEAPARPGLAPRVPPGAIPMPPEGEIAAIPAPPYGTPEFGPPTLEEPGAPGAARPGRSAPSVAEALPVPRPGRPGDRPEDFAAAPEGLDTPSPGPGDDAAGGPAADAARAALDETPEPGAEPAPPADLDAAAPADTDEPPPPVAEIPESPAPPPTEEQQQAAAPATEGAAAPPARVVMPYGGRSDGTGTTAAPVEVETVADPELVRLLRQLSYLDPATGAEPTPAEFEAAVTDFAADEKIAMPAKPGEIKQRLEAAIDRTAELSSCGETAGTGYGVCLDRKP